MRAAAMEVFACILIFRKSCSRFWDTLEAAVKSCESAVDMVLARMPASTIPATMERRKPWPPSSPERRIIIVSESALEVKVSSFPAAETPHPIIPMRIATNMEMTTHTEAIRRDKPSLFSSSIAIKRRRIWGIPKYPSPQAIMEKMEIML